MEAEEYLANEGQEVENPALNAEIQPEQIEEPVASEPIIEAKEQIRQEVIEANELFVLKVGRQWFKSWSPFELCDKKSEAMILKEDKANGFKSSMNMIKKLNATLMPI